MSNLTGKGAAPPLPDSRSPLKDVWLWVTVIVGATLVAVGCLLIAHAKFYDYVSVVSTIWELGGLLIAIVEIGRVRRETNRIASEVQQTREKLARRASIEDIRRALQLVKEINLHLRENRDGFAELRIIDLREVLRVLHATPSGIASDKNKSELQKLTNSLTGQAAGSFIQGSDKYTKLVQTLDTVHGILIVEEQRDRFE